MCAFQEDADSDQLNLGKPSEDVVKTRIQRLTQELEDSKILLRVVKVCMYIIIA